MKNLKVLLRENVESLGQIGEVVRVRSGYARNYLFPRRLAIEANPDNMRAMERRRVRFEAEEKAREADITARIESLGKLRLAVVEKADATGTLYGSVGPRDIADALTKAGTPVEKSEVVMGEGVVLARHSVSFLPGT